MSTPSIAIVTMMIGSDYSKAMEPGLNSKRAYAAKHNYDLQVGGTDVWDRRRPISWTKLKFILKFLDNYDYIFWSDADVVIMDSEKKLETHVLPLLPPNKDMLWTKDVCGNLNAGNMLLRGKSAWVRDMFTRAYAQEDLIHHIWWDNAALIRMISTNPNDEAKVETITDFTRFNSYLFGPKNLATDPDARMYQPGDFLIHFAGVSDPWNIYRMMKYMELCQKRNIPHNTQMLDGWYKMQVASKAEADQILNQM
jgi:hypothetical protein